MDTQTTSPTATVDVQPNFNKLIDNKSAKFSFRKTKDAETGVETKRATVELDRLPVPSVEGIMEILSTGGKWLELLQEAVQDVVVNRARDVINGSETITSANFDYSTLSWDAIANLEKEDRRSGIAKETWEDFGVDYTEVMPALTGCTKEQAANAAKLFVTKFAQAKHKKSLLEKLKLRLAMYAEHSPKAAEFAECIEFLLVRADKYITAKEESLEDSLGL